MRPLLSLLLSGLLLGTACATTQAAPTRAATDLAAMLDRQAQDWNRGDLEAFCRVYTDDATFISPSGVAKGRAQILTRYQKKYDTPEKRGKLSFDIVETRVHGTSASIALRWKIEKTDSQAEGLSLIVLVRDGEAWKIVQDASM